MHAERGTELIVYGHRRAGLMERIVEPELMLDADQALRLLPGRLHPTRTRPRSNASPPASPTSPAAGCLDLACGPADVTVRFAARLPALPRSSASTGRPAMLALGRERVADAGFADRVTLEERLLPDPGLAGLGPFDAVVCTSALHHFHDPAVLWDTVRVLRTGRQRSPRAGPDAARHERATARKPSSNGTPSDDPEVLQRDYFHSLCAAFTVDEVRGQLDTAELGSLAVEAVSDRHLLVTGTVA